MKILVVAVGLHTTSARLIIDEYKQEDVTAQLDEIRSKKNEDESENVLLAQILNCSLVVYCLGGYIETYKV
jgi:hypothetical protein